LPASVLHQRLQRSPKLDGPVLKTQILVIWPPNFPLWDDSRHSSEINVSKKFFAIRPLKGRRRRRRHVCHPRLTTSESRWERIAIMNKSFSVCCSCSNRNFCVCFEDTLHVGEHFVWGFPFSSRV
jgi:hypothetical protein